MAARQTVRDGLPPSIQQLPLIKGISSPKASMISINSLPKREGDCRILESRTPLDRMSGDFNQPSPRLRGHIAHCDILCGNSPNSRSICFDGQCPNQIPPRTGSLYYTSVNSRSSTTSFQHRKRVVSVSCHNVVIYCTSPRVHIGKT